MAASIDDLDRHLAEILKVLQATGKAQGTGGTGGTQPGAKTLKDHFGDAFKKAQKSNSLETMGKDLAGKAGGMAGKLTTTSGALSAGWEGMKLWYTASQKVREFANELHSANRQFAQFSPSMAMVMAQSDMRDAMRKMQQGEQLASSAGGLANTRARLEDQLTPIDTEWQRLQNRFGEAVTGGMATFLEKSEFGKQLTELMKQAGDFAFGEEPEPPPDEWLKELDKMVKGEEGKIQARTEPVRKPQRDPRPNLPWDRQANRGEF